MPRIIRRYPRLYCGTLSLIVRSGSLKEARQDIDDFFGGMGVFPDGGALLLEDEVTLLDGALTPCCSAPTYHSELLACLKSLAEWAATMGEWEAPCWAEAKRLVEAATLPEEANAGQ